MKRSFWLLVALISACSADGDGGPDMSVVDPLIAARPYDLLTPAGYDRTRSWPLLVVLHGYSADGALEDGYLGLGLAADTRGYFVVRPDGLLDSYGQRYWNATDACCDFFKSGVDDVAYLTALIADISRRYTIDAKRVFLFGHSNGGFMAHRMACDRADLIAGFIALAGDVWKDTSRCQPSKPVAMAQLHGDADDTILWDGGMLPKQPPYPSAEASVAFWQTAGGCTGTADGDPMDLDSTLAGAETTVTRATGCVEGAAAEMWRMHGGSHTPSFSPSFVPAVYDFFAAHPEP